MHRTLIFLLWSSRKPLIRMHGGVLSELGEYGSSGCRNCVYFKDEYLILKLVAGSNRWMKRLHFRSCQEDYRYKGGSETFMEGLEYLNRIKHFSMEVI